MCAMIKSIALFALSAVLCADLGLANYTFCCVENSMWNVFERFAELSAHSEQVRIRLAQLNGETAVQLDALDNLKQLLNKNCMMAPPPIDVRTATVSQESTYPLQSSLPAPTERLPADCEEAVQRAGRMRSGVYQLQLPNTDFGPFSVYCLLDPDGNGTAWTVVQRRQDGSTNFYRDWNEYKRGFGFAEHDYFVGLEKLHTLTHSRMHELWIEMADFENERRRVKYNLFAIDDEKSQYALNILGQFEGDAGDSLREHFGKKFTTRDVDNDDNASNCAVLFTGAWWYSSCHKSNLNGQYLGGAYPKDKYGKGIDWYTWHDHQYSLKYVHMAIRPIESHDN